MCQSEKVGAMRVTISFRFSCASAMCISHYLTKVQNTADRVKERK